MSCIIHAESFVVFGGGKYTYSWKKLLSPTMFNAMLKCNAQIGPWILRDVYRYVGMYASQNRSAQPTAPKILSLGTENYMTILSST